MAVIIKDLLPAPVFIEVQKDKGFDVRGLRMDETIDLLTRYQKPLAAFFGSSNLDFELLLADAPKLCAEVIAFCADAKGQEDDIMLLPPQSQIEALMAIWELSVPNVKKLLASLQKASASLAVARSIPQP